MLGGHRSKVIFNGTDDLSTLEYVSRVAGTEHVAQRGWSADTGGGRRTVSEHLQREDLLPAHVVRQMRRQEAVLLHGTLPPIHLRTVCWWEDRHLAALVPTGRDGRPLPPPTTGTCPMRDGPRGSVSPVLDPAVVSESVNHLPRPRDPSPRPAGPTAAPRSSRVPPVGQGQLRFAAIPDPGPPAGEPVGRNRVAGYCDGCGVRLAVGAARVESVGGREVLRCDPACPGPAGPAGPPATAP